MLLVLRAWIVNRGVVGTALMAALVSVALPVTAPRGPMMRLVMWQSRPEFLVPFVSMLSVAAVIAATMSAMSRTPEWEPGPLWRVRWAQACTWMLGAVAPTMIGPFVMQMRSGGAAPARHIASVYAFQLVAAGLASFCISLGGQVVGSIMTVVLSAGLLLCEQFWGTCWPFPSGDRSPQWAWDWGLLAVGLLAQLWRAGRPLIRW